MREIKAEVQTGPAKAFYDRASRRYDQGKTKVHPTRALKSAIHDDLIAQQNARFDIQARDHRAKFERPRFSVVGEERRSAREAYRRNFDLIDWRA